LQNFKDFDESNAQVARDISDKFENNCVARKKRKKEKRKKGETEATTTTFLQKMCRCTPPDQTSCTTQR
jgi:hypothetical protein